MAVSLLVVVFGTRTEGGLAHCTLDKWTLHFGQVIITALWISGQVIINQDGVFYWENSPDYLTLAVKYCFRGGAYGSLVSQ